MAGAWEGRNLILSVVPSPRLESTQNPLQRMSDAFLQGFPIFSSFPDVHRAMGILAGDIPGKYLKKMLQGLNVNYYEGST